MIMNKKNISNDILFSYENNGYLIENKNDGQEIRLNKEELFSLYCEIEDMLEEERTDGF